MLKLALYAAILIFSAQAFAWGTYVPAIGAEKAQLNKAWKAIVITKGQLTKVKSMVKQKQSRPAICAEIKKLNRSAQILSKAYNPLSQGYPNTLYFEPFIGILGFCERHDDKYSHGAMTVAFNDYKDLLENLEVGDPKGWNIANQVNGIEKYIGRQLGVVAGENPSVTIVEGIIGSLAGVKENLEEEKSGPIAGYSRAYYCSSLARNQGLLQALMVIVLNKNRVQNEEVLTVAGGLEGSGKYLSDAGLAVCEKNSSDPEDLKALAAKIQEVISALQLKSPAIAKLSK